MKYFWAHYYHGVVEDLYTQVVIDIDSHCVEKSAHKKTDWDTKEGSQYEKDC